ncbi:hypothetical protein N7495_009574 [Penicillium taxi]|uniref:uncharacterized protein n=1 Tax=Penicillium taxi TaxID=168475 RepID=UPI002545AAEF|nr:uncharacterized protein N7495_009574 [Penicillium taxi]KAJ5885064.1 hypothetical protein N7495_009574 [Penicillium taxi]
MKFTTLANVLALASSALSAPAVAEKRADSFQIGAYGVESSVLTLFYSDGIAYFGDSSAWTWGSVTTDVTFVYSDSEIVATATTDGVTLDADTLFYIRPTADEVLPVGFTGNGIETPSDAVSNSWIFYGNWPMYEETSGSLSDSFRVKETNVTGVYEAYFDYSNLYPTGYSIANVRKL